MAVQLIEGCGSLVREWAVQRSTAGIAGGSGLLEREAGRDGRGSIGTGCHTTQHQGMGCLILHRQFCKVGCDGIAILERGN